jgi:ankyrin repeat protein
MKNDLDIFRIIESGEIVDYLTAINQIDINVRNDRGESLLHRSIVGRHRRISIDLIDKSINVNIKNNKGETVLHYLCDHPDIVIAQRILEKGGNLSIKDDWGNAPLWCAVFNSHGNYELVKLFLKFGSDPKDKNKAGKSPLDFANQINDQELLLILQNLTN